MGDYSDYIVLILRRRYIFVVKQSVFPVTLNILFYVRNVKIIITYESIY